MLSLMSLICEGLTTQEQLNTSVLMEYTLVSKSGVLGRSRVFKSYKMVILIYTSFLSDVNLWIC